MPAPFPGQKNLFGHGIAEEGDGEVELLDTETREHHEHRGEQISSPHWMARLTATIGLSAPTEADWRRS